MVYVLSAVLYLAALVGLVHYAFLPHLDWSSGGRLLAQGAYVFYAHLAVFAVAAVAAAKIVRDRTRRNDLVVLFLAASFLFFCLVGLKSHALEIVKIIVALAWFTTGSLGVMRVSGRIFNLDLPFYAAALVLLTAIELVLFVPGAFGLAGRPVHLVLAALPMTFFLPAAGDARFWRGLWEDRPWKSMGLPGLFWAEGFFLLLCLAVLQTAAPETLVDAVQLHIPKSMLMAEQGGIRGVLLAPYQAFFFMPGFLHVLFSFGYVLLGEIGVSVLSTALIFVLVSAMRDMGRRLDLPFSYCLAGAVLFLVTPAFFWMLGSGYLDFPSVVFALGGAALFLRGMQGEGRGRAAMFVLAGVLAGASVNIKLNLYVLWVVFVSLAGVFSLAGRGAPRLRMKDGLLFVLAAAGFCLPHYAVMYVLTDNPVYPQLNGLFGSPYWDNSMPVAQHVFHDFKWHEVLILPVYMVFKTSWFGENLNGSGGMWLLYFLPCLVFFPRDGRAKFFWLLLAVAVSYVAGLYALTSNYYRYYMAVFPILALVLAAGARNFAARALPGEKARAIAGSVFAVLALCVSLPQFGLGFFPSTAHWDYYLRGEPRQWLDRFYPADLPRFLSFVDTLPQETQILADGLELVTAIPRRTFEIDIATLDYSGLQGVHPRDIKSRRSPVAARLTEQMLGFSYDEAYRARTGGYTESASAHQGLVEYAADVYAVFNMWSYEYAQRHDVEYISAERLVYSSATETRGGVRPRFITAFRVNDEMFEPPPGYAFTASGENLDVRPAIMAEPGWFLADENGNTTPAGSLADPFTGPGQSLVGVFAVPETSAVFNLVLNLRYMGEPAPETGLALGYFDENNEPLKETVPASFARETSAAYVVRDEVPGRAGTLVIQLAPPPGRKVGIDSYSLFFEYE